MRFHSVSHSACETSVFGIRDNRSLAGRLQKPSVGVEDAFSKRDAGGPTEGADFFDVEKFARGAVRLRCVEYEIAIEAQCLADRLGEFADRNVFAATDIHNLGGVIIFEEKKTGVSEVIHMQEFPARRASTPDGNRASAAGFSFVNLAEEGREDVRGAKIEVVIRAIEVRRHGGDEVFAILLRVGLAKFDAGDFCQSIGIVSGFQRTGEEGILADRLRC